MKIVKSSSKGYFQVLEVPNEISNYIRYKIPYNKRIFSEHWFITVKYIPSLVKFARGRGIVVDVSSLPAYITKHLGEQVKTSPSATLYLIDGAPEYIVDAVWKAIAKKWHPDKEGGDSSEFLKFKEAYDHIKEPECP